MLEIDGAYGEGGGQLVRTACALAAITSIPIRLFSIRAHRAPSGLAPQHLAAVRAVAAMCAARCEGLALRASGFDFVPAALQAGQFRFDVGTAGSVSLVAQAVLPVALSAPGSSRLTIIGGTDVRAAPPLDYLRYVLMPLLAQLGARVSIEVVQRGYYPRGGGVVAFTVEPARLGGVALDVAGPVAALGGALHVANLPVHILERMEHTVRARLASRGALALVPDLLGPDRAAGPGGACVLWAQTAHALLGAGEVAQRGIPAEEIAARAVRGLVVELESGATLDIHAADQLLIYLALAGVPSHFRVREYSSHARTTAWLLEQFLPVAIRATAVNDLTQVEVIPR